MVMRKSAWSILKSSATDWAYCFYEDTAKNRLGTDVLSGTYFADYQMYAYYRWSLRGELEYIPHVKNLTQKQRDTVNIEAMNINFWGRPTRYPGFKRYIFCAWDREEVSLNAYDNYLLMAEVRWFARGG